MSYMKEIDRQVRETIDAIMGIIARYFPESEWRGWMGIRNRTANLPSCSEHNSNERR